MNNTNRAACLLLVFCLGFQYTQAQKRIKSAKKVERLLSETYAKVADACVKLIVRDTLNNRDLGGFSGVIVTSDGLILTAAHSVKPGYRYRTEYPDGKKGVALALGKIALEEKSRKYDMAVLKLEDAKIQHFASMSDSKNLRVGEACVGISYPGSFFQSKPNLRFGHITRLDDGYGLLESTCMMEPGDSGGGLFNLQGELIGIRDAINLSEKENFDIPVNLFKKYWTSLQKKVNYKKLPPEDSLLVKQKTSTPPIMLPQSELTKLNNLSLPGAISLHSVKDSLQQKILSTPLQVDFNGKKQTLLVSKSSMVDDQIWMEDQGLKVFLNVIGRDFENDLVLLQIPDGKAAIRGLDISRYNYHSISLADLGKFMISPLDSQKRKIGVVSTLEIELPLLFSRAELGALIIEEGGKMIVKDIAPSYPAESFLKIGDQITDINDQKIVDAASYAAKSNTLIYGDNIKFGIIRGGKKMSMRITVQERFFMGVSNNYQGRRSLRSDGFKKVFVQDAPIRSDECGGPVYDKRGNFIGINIARHSRTSTIILPLDEVEKSIVKIIMQASRNQK